MDAMHFSLRTNERPSSSVGIATEYRPEVPGMESGGGARFSAPV